MAHILIITGDIASLYNSGAALAVQLKQAGHKVTFASTHDIGAFIKAQGLSYIQLDTPKQLQRDTSTSKIQKLIAWVGKWTTIRQRRQSAVVDLGMDKFSERLNELSPDVCIIEIELHAHIISALALNIPVALLSVRFAMRKHKSLPPLHLHVVPGQGWEGSAIGIELAWLRVRLWKWSFHLLQFIRTAGTDQLSIMRLLAQQVGFPFDSETEKYQWLLPFSYKNVPVLSFNAFELEVPHTPHPTLHYVGPMILHDRVDTAVTPNAQETDNRLRSLFERRANGESKALVYCAFGAYFKGDDSSFFQRVIDAVAIHPEWDVIIGLGNRITLEQLENLPSNVHAFPWVPQVLALKHADCAVIHGGISSVNEALHYQVPILSYPFKYVNDQPGTATRVAYHQVGIVGDRDKDDATTISNNIETLLTDSSYKARIKAMRQNFQTYYDRKPSVDVIEQLLN